MNTFSTLNLGNFPANTASIVVTGMTYPTSGTYFVEALVDGKFRTASGVVVAGNTVTIANNYPSDATVFFRVRLPVSDRTSSSNYLNDANGHIWFQFTNVPV
jgi:hypothetical protein